MAYKFNFYLPVGQSTVPVQSVSELSPGPYMNQKSFYGKARVVRYVDGVELLVSYNTPVLFRDHNGKLFRCWNGYSATTGKHVRSFGFVNKAEYQNLPVLPGTVRITYGLR